MATDKQGRFYQAMADRFGIMADPTRLAVIHCLMEGGEQNVTTIVGVTGHGHPKVSKHLRVLREAGSVGRRKDGLQVFYRLSDPLVDKLCRRSWPTLSRSLARKDPADRVRRSVRLRRPAKTTLSSVGSLVLRRSQKELVRAQPGEDNLLQVQPGLKGRYVAEQGEVLRVPTRPKKET